MNIEVVGHVCIKAHRTLSYVCMWLLSLSYANRDMLVSNVEDICEVFLWTQGKYKHFWIGKHHVQLTMCNVSRDLQISTANSSEVTRRLS